ncbi:MAG: hypothetical protein ACFHWZ_04495 [Phycisphaerales bacterium]
MARKNTRNSFGYLASAAAVMLLSGSVLAQDGPRRGPSDALRGPSVNDRAMPRNERFGDSMMEGRRRDAGMLNYRVLVGTIGDLADHENQRLRLTAEQSEKLASIREGYEKQLREYMSEAREQTQNLRQRIQKAREQAGDDREAVQEIMEKARARAEEIRANAPKSDKAEAKMWEVLSQPQQRFVKAQIEERTDEMMRDRQMERDRANRGTGAQRPDRPGAEGGDPMRPGADRPTDRQTDRADPSMRRWAQLFQRIQRLTPEQQDRLFNMINSTLERVDASRGSDRPASGPDAERPRRPAPDAQRDSDRPSGARPEPAPRWPGRPAPDLRFRRIEPGQRTGLRCAFSLGISRQSRRRGAATPRSPRPAARPDRRLLPQR